MQNLENKTTLFFWHLKILLLINKATLLLTFIHAIIYDICDCLNSCRYDNEKEKKSRKKKKRFHRESYIRRTCNRQKNNIYVEAKRPNKERWNSLEKIKLGKVKRGT